MEANMIQVTLDWFCASELSELDDYQKILLEKKGGIYIWIFKGMPERVAYVGECADFMTRFRDHIFCQISGQYLGFDIRQDEDFIQFLNKYYIKIKINDIINGKKVYIPITDWGRNKIGGKFSFKRFWSEEYTKINLSFLKNLRFVFCTVSNNIERKEVEAALLIGLRSQYCKILEKEDVTQFKIADYGKSNNTPLGNISKYPTAKCFTIKHEGSEKTKIPDEIINIKHYPFQDT